jgi:hypothetical protein
MILHLHAAAIMDSVRVPGMPHHSAASDPPDHASSSIARQDLVQPFTPWRKFPT